MNQQVGVLVDPARRLHLYINGVDQGVAADTVPEKVKGVEGWGRGKEGDRGKGGSRRKGEGRGKGRDREDRGGQRRERARVRKGRMKGRRG